MTGNDFVQRPWHFSVAAKGQAFDAVSGFSHRVRTVYKKGPNVQVQWDQAFGSELDQLLEAFDSTSAGAVEIVEVDAIMNPQREAALEAQLVQWKERMNKGGVFDAGWNKDGLVGCAAKQQVLGELSKRRHDMHNSGVLAFAGPVDGTIAPSICSNGFAVLIEQDGKTDDGYFAKGVYVTFHSAYAAIYGGGLVPLKLQDPSNEMVITAAWAAVVNPYTLYHTWRRLHAQSNLRCDLLGQTVKGGYDSQFVLVDGQGGPGSLDYQAYEEDEEEGSYCSHREGEGRRNKNRVSHSLVLCSAHSCAGCARARCRTDGNARRYGDGIKTGVEGAKAVAAALRGSSAVDLDLATNNIGDEGAKAVLEGVRGSKVANLL
jgi:hypothetical protein